MLTAKQHQAYEFIRNYIQRHDYAPTEAEIAAGIGIKSRGVAHRYVTALAEAGYIELVPNRRRNIVLVDRADESKSDAIPVIGRIAAGRPIAAIEDNRTFNVAHALLGPKRFILEVQGDSMIGDNICDGDYIICESAQTADNDKIVVALIDNEEATLKRLRVNSDGTVTLIPSNPTLKPMVFDAGRVQIQGVYLGLLRLN